MDVKFVASVSVVAADPASSRKLYVDALALPLKRLDGEYDATEELGRLQPFWSLAAEPSCSGVLRHERVAQRAPGPSRRHRARARNRRGNGCSGS